MKRFFVLMCLLFGCTKESSAPKNNAKKPLVLVSVSPYDTFVKKLAGDTMDVQTLVPYGQNGHIFEPTAKQLAPLSRAKIFVGIGDLYEQKVYESVRSHNPYMIALNLSKQPGEDNHFWMSPRIVAKQLVPITQAMIRVSPKNKQLYLDNLEALTKELEKLQKVIAYKLKPYKGRAVVTSHEALGYYCEDFGLVQLALEHHGKEALPARVKDLVSRAWAEKAICVFTQAGFDNRGALIVAKELDIPIYELDPQNPAYFENMKKITLEITGNAENQ